MEKTDIDTEEQVVVTEGSDLPEAIAAAEIDEIAKLKDLVTEHGVRILTGVCIGLIIVGAISFYRTNQQTKLVNSSLQLSSARSLQDLESLVSQYPSTPSAPLALLKMAKIHYSNESLDMAISTYDEFQTKYSEHPLFLAAELGKAHCIEGKGELDQALTIYSDFISANSDHYLGSQAVLGKARCLVGLDRKQEAKEAYEDFIVKNAESQWLPMVEEKLAEITTESK